MEKAVIIVKGDDEKKIDVDFNPSEYSVSFTPKYNEKAGATQGKQLPEFITEAVETLSLSLTLDGFSQGRTLDETKAKDISERVKQLKALTKIDESLHSPPECSFQWGSFRFDGFVTDLSAQFTMFSSEGKPLRASIKLSIIKKDMKPVALQSPDRTKRRVLREGTPLYLVAQEVYGDCGQWRLIAVANGIKNPLRVEAGTVLKIPPLE